MPERYREHCLPCSTQSGRSAPKLFSQERTVRVVIAPCLPHLLLSSGVCSLGMHENLLPEHSDCRRLWIPGGRALIDGAHPSHGRGQNRSEEHTSELQSLMRISYAVFCLKKKK